MPFPAFLKISVKFLVYFNFYKILALLGDLARRVPKQIDVLWEKFEKKEEIIWAAEKTKESSLYRFDTVMVENAARNETSSMVAFPVYVLAQELQLFGPTEDGYINLYRAIRDLPGNWFLKNFNPWRANDNFLPYFIWPNMAKRIFSSKTSFSTQKIFIFAYAKDLNRL